MYSMDLKHCAALFEMYSITHADEFMLKFVDAIQTVCDEIEKQLICFQAKNYLKLENMPLKLKITNQYVTMFYDNLLNILFTVEKDPIRIIQYKEIYENLEDIADYCQTVANTLETIIMKNA